VHQPVSREGKPDHEQSVAVTIPVPSGPAAGRSRELHVDVQPPRGFRDRTPTATGTR
jgi:hypothetical protein